MRQKLKARRHKILNLLAFSNREERIVEQVVKEFGCSEEAVRRDLKKVGLWAPELQKTDQIAPILSARMDMLHREAMQIVVDDNVNDSVKIRAINSASKISVEQAKFRLNHAADDPKSVEVASRFSVGIPCEADPKLKEAMAEFVEKQRAEKKMRIDSAQAAKAEGEKVAEKPSNATGT